MERIDILSTLESIEDFKDSIIWKDIVNELLAWKEGFNREMMSIVDESATSNPSTANVLMHLGDLNGRMKAVDYMIGLPDVFVSIIKTRKEETEEASDE